MMKLYEKLGAVEERVSSRESLSEQSMTMLQNAAILKECRIAQHILMKIMSAESKADDPAWFQEGHGTHLVRTSYTELKKFANTYQGEPFSVVL